MDFIYNGPFYIKIGLGLYTIIQYLEYMKRLKAVGHFAIESYNDIQRLTYTYDKTNHIYYTDLTDNHITHHPPLDPHQIQEEYLGDSENHLP